MKLLIEWSHIIIPIFVKSLKTSRESVAQLVRARDC